MKHLYNPITALLSHLSINLDANFCVNMMCGHIAIHCMLGKLKTDICRFHINEAIDDSFI